jgi:hypothetical protein
MIIVSWGRNNKVRRRKMLFLIYTLHGEKKSAFQIHGNTKLFFTKFATELIKPVKRPVFQGEKGKIYFKKPLFIFCETRI